MSVWTILLTFFLSTLVGNRLLQWWQLRNWFNQQRFAGEEKEYVALKEVADDIIAMSGLRLNRMRRLRMGLTTRDAEVIEERRSDYEATVIQWNEKLNSYVVKLTFYADYQMATRLYHDVHERFVSAGRGLEALVRLAKEQSDIPGSRLRYVESTLNTTYIGLSDFNRDLVRYMEIKRQEVYFGRKVSLEKDNLELFSNWELFKGLFKPREKPLTVVRPSVNFERPLRRTPEWPWVH